MKITFDIHHRVLHDGFGNPLDFDRHYDMPDGEHRFIFRRLNNDSLMVEIKKGRKHVVQRSKIRLLSAIMGNGADGEPVRQTHAVELDPNREIFPISELVDAILTMGVKWWQVTPMPPGYTLTDYSASHSSPHMASDGEIKRFEHSATGDMLRSTEFAVRGASWAILYFGKKVTHIYLWPEAAENAEAVLDAVRQIRAGELNPTYA